MDDQPTAPEAPTQAQINNDPPATLVDISNRTFDEVDTASQSNTLPPLPSSGRFGVSFQDIETERQRLHYLLSGIREQGSQELATPISRRPDLTPETLAQHDRQSSMVDYQSRALPPLPDSSVRPSFDPFATPVRATSSFVPPNVDDGCEEPARWTGVLPQSSLFNSPPRTSFPVSTTRNYSNVAQATEADQNKSYDARWAKQMEERTTRIQTEQRSSCELENSGPSNMSPMFGAVRSPISHTPSARRSFLTKHLESTDAWRHRLCDNPSRRPDIPSRNAALETISNILFNFDTSQEDQEALLEDVCSTANQVGVSTVELLAQTVTIGNYDLGMTPLCLEVSRCDLDGGLNVLMWLLEHVSSGTIERDLRTGCLMRNNGMGDQLMWSTAKLFIPEVENQAVFAYDALVENVFVAPGGAGVKEEPDEDDEGSLYDDGSLVEVDQADIETLKSSEDEEEPSFPPISKVHRARIDVPNFESLLLLDDEEVTPAYTALPPWSPSNKMLSSSFRVTRSMPMENRVLTTEWMYEGRVWALAIGQDKLVLTLRHTSQVVSSDPIQVKAFVRIFSYDTDWNQVQELETTGSDRLLPTHSILISPAIPVYSCEFDEAMMSPGPPSGGNTSMWKEGIRMSKFSLLDSVGEALKVEILIKTTEATTTPRPADVCRENSVGNECGGKKGRESVHEDSDAEWVDDF